MTAAEWNEKHPIGTRVIFKNGSFRAAHFTKSDIDRHENIRIESPELGTDFIANFGSLEPISAYPGDMYEGKPLKKVRME